LKYYKVSLLRSSAPTLIYKSNKDIVVGSLIRVPLKSTLKDAVVLEETKKPPFECEIIDAVTDRIFSKEQMQIAKFISEYYFSSFSEAISLFLPYRRGVSRGHPLDAKHIQTESLSHGQPQGIAPILSSSQQKAYEEILQRDKSLLFGVTGSGKTEIFISLISKMLDDGKSSIFLMPEISLTPQMEKRLRVYFGDAVAMWHSKITQKKKEQILKGIESGDIRIIAGARSALFVPLESVGLIIVDEEHDDSYKAHTRPRYHARDVAVLMAQKLNAKVLLASATPSVTTYYKYDVIKLDEPYIKSAKTYSFMAGETIDNTIVKEIDKNYKDGKQSLLFLPTRANFKYLYCKNCGKTHLCPYCSVGMALHRKNKMLKCHYCNYTEPIAQSCSYCGYEPLSSERIGTQEAIEILQNSIEGIKIEQFDRDSITTARKLKDALKRFENTESDLLLGTQMLSKGHDYANITLSVIMGLDHILGLADYRARERAMSLFVQIAGRSGRAQKSKVLVQTNNSEFFKAYLDDYEEFIKDELKFLQDANYPPFASLARALIANKDESKATKITMDTVDKIKKFENIEIVGHGKAPVEKIANKYRFQILLRSASRVTLLKALHSVNRREIEIDMDPVEFS